MSKIAVYFGVLFFIFGPVAGVAQTQEGGKSMLTMNQLHGTVMIPVTRINTIFYRVQDDPGAAMLKVVYSGILEGVSQKGAEAAATWQAIQDDSSLFSKFVWLPHMGGTVGIAYSSVQSVFFSAAADGKPARLRIAHDIDAKVVEGETAEKVWKTLQNR